MGISNILGYQLDGFCRKVLRNEARNYFRAMQYKSKNEISFTDLVHQQEEPFQYDFYPSELWQFSVNEHDFLVENEELARALQALQSQNRDIVLLSFFLELTDEEIATMLHMVRRTVQYRRVKTIKEMRDRLEVIQHEKKRKS